MKNWKDILISPDRSIREALLRIDAIGSQMALVIGQDARLVGTVSDGDIRRGLLKGLSLADPVERCMHLEPHFARATDSKDSVLAIMRRERLHQMPILDDADHVVGMEVLDDHLLPTARENWIVLMAGGLGTRLGELTKTTPKPMLPVGGRPLLETIVRRFVDQGFVNFYLSVNYMADVIERHFGSGERFGARIRYLREIKRMGTAGSLSLLPDLPAEPLIVANGDLLADIDYAHMLDEHVDSDVAATMGVSEYESQIPYGVVHRENGFVTRIEEKPVHKSLISAGVYVLSPHSLGLIPHDTFFDMPSLFEALIACECKVSTYKVHGYWLDIGAIPDYQKANSDIGTVFR